MMNCEEDYDSQHKDIRCPCNACYTKTNDGQRGKKFSIVIHIKVQCFSVIFFNVKGK
jgi:hypothetical protein